MNKFTVYTDGSCVPNPGPCSWGAILLRDGVELAEAFSYIGIGTNNIAEITAATEGLRMTPVGAVVELVSDSQYTLKGISEWREGWERRGWKTSAKKDVENIAQWKALYAEVDKRVVSVRWVKGHDKDRYNNIADKLADSGRKHQFPAGEHERIVVRALSDDYPPGGFNAATEKLTPNVVIGDHSDKLTQLLNLLKTAEPTVAANVLDSAIAQLSGHGNHADRFAREAGRVFRPKP